MISESAIRLELNGSAGNGDFCLYDYMRPKDYPGISADYRDAIIQKLFE